LLWIFGRLELQRVSSSSLLLLAWGSFARSSLGLFVIWDLFASTSYLRVLLFFCEPTFGTGSVCLWSGFMVSGGFFLVFGWDLVFSCNLCFESWWFFCSCTQMAIQHRGYFRALETLSFCQLEFCRNGPDDLVCIWYWMVPFATIQIFVYLFLASVFVGSTPQYMG